MSQPTTPSPRPTIGGLMMLVFMVAIFLATEQSSRLTVFSGLSLLIAGILLLPWILIPMRIYQNQRLMADPDPRLVDLDAPDMPEPVASAVREAIPKLEEMGFSHLGCYRTSVAHPFQAAFVTLFQNRKTYQLAKLVSIVVPRRKPAASTTAFLFQTDFADGTILATAYVVIFRLHPRPGHIRDGSMSFSYIKNSNHLYEIHEASLACCAPHERRAGKLIEDPEGHLRTTSEREYAAMIESGYWRLDESERTYRPTYKGAILMTWRLIWPVKPIRQALLRAQGRRFIADLGLEP